MGSSVVIIGAGLSGSLTALNILAGSSPSHNIEVTLIDPRGSFGPGLAYSVPSDRFKLNVRAKAMGAFPDDPESFYRWLKERNPSVSPNDFVSGRLYGEYLQELVQDAARSHPSSFSLLAGEAIDVLSLGESRGFDILLADSTRIRADTVILAVGNILRRSVDQISTEAFLRDPYMAQSYTDVASAREIFLLGSSLTAVDVILECEGRGFKGNYTVVSRNGRFPLPHEDTASLPSAALPSDLDLLRTPRNLLRFIREESERCTSSQPVFDALRPITQQIWRTFSEKQRRAFLRHLRPFWETHRHRIPAEHVATLEHLRAASRSRIIPAKVVEVKKNAITIHRTRLGDEVIGFEIGFMCAGPEGDISLIRHPLIQNLIQHGLIEPGPLRLGIAGTSPERAPSFYVVGPLDRERLWEITAVRELREQAHEVAGLIRGA